MRLYWAPEAAAELDVILTFIAERSPDGARLVGACIQRAEQILTEHPKIGQLTSASPPAVRRLVLRPYPYVMFYEVGETEIMVIGLRHGARDPSSMPSGS